MSAILTLLWANREIIAKGLVIALIAFFCWWFFLHNPKVIKRLETEKTELSRQVVLRDNAINLLGTIERAHDEIDQQTGANIRWIRTAPKPSRTGYLILDGVLPTLFKTYSAAR